MSYTDIDVKKDGVRLRQVHVIHGTCLQSVSDVIIAGEDKTERLIEKLQEYLSLLKETSNGRTAKEES